MRSIFSYDKRLIEEDLFAFSPTDAVLLPDLSGVPIVPLEARRSGYLVQGNPPVVYVDNIL
jgi:hypothetical protein